MMAVVNVRLYNIRSHVANAAEKLSGTPEVSLTKMSSQPRMLTEKFVGAAAFQQLERSGDAHNRRQINKQMDMINLNMKLKYCYIVKFCYLAQKLLTMFANNLKLERIHSILGFPHKVECVLSNTVTKTRKSFYHFLFLRAIFCGAHATTIF